MTMVTARVHPVHLMNADWAPVAVNPQTSQPTWAVSPPINGCYCPHPPSPFIIITQPKSSADIHFTSHGGWKAESNFWCMELKWYWQYVQWVGPCTCPLWKFIKKLSKETTRHRASTSSRWHFAFGTVVIATKPMHRLQIRPIEI